jgi:hypothetical protein
LALACPEVNVLANGPQPPTIAGKLTQPELSALIDRRIQEKWLRDNVQPVPPCDDGTFFRRVHLDLAGKIPTVLDIRDFIDDDRPDKRAIWIDKILEGPAFGEHFANIFRAIILPQVEDQQTAFLVGGFENWLRKKLKEGAGYDKMIHELLTAGRNFNRGFDGTNSPTPVAFYSASEYKPENLAGSTARLFLGVKIECAQCHKHPFASWTRNQFWEFAAFFSRLNVNNPFQPPNPKMAQAAPLPLEPEIQIPKTEEKVTAHYLDGSKPTWKDGMDPVAVLADWLVSPKNPYFAKVTVNRVWEYFLGVGLVDPVDDFGPHNLASHPELLDELANQFILSGFDVKQLARAIVNSKAYQLCSTPLGQKGPDDDSDPNRLFARMPLRALTGEQLFESLAEVMEYPVDKTRQPIQGLGLNMRDEFLAKFANAENRRINTSTSILQALHLMNGRFMANATSLEKNKTLATIAQSQVPSAKRVESLFLVALSRLPTQIELERFARYLDSGGPSGDPNRALADVLWVLLNSSEFAINH